MKPELMMALEKQFEKPRPKDTPPSIVKSWIQQIRDTLNYFYGDNWGENYKEEEDERRRKTG
jgi:hypothetical protein